MRGTAGEPQVRHTLSELMSPEEAVEEMVEENEPALHVLTEIINKHKMPEAVILDLDDMNIRGEQIQIGLQVCEGSIKKFVELVLARSQWLVDEINKECLRHKAVTSGASFFRIRRT